MDDKTLTMTMLLDFYGELLTEKQRGYFEMYYNEDLTLSEIAELEGISRQGVWDIIQRAETALRETERKTGLIRRFNESRELVGELEIELDRLIGIADGQAKTLACRIREKLQELRR